MSGVLSWLLSLEFDILRADRELRREEKPLTKHASIRYRPPVKHRGPAVPIDVQAAGPVYAIVGHGRGEQRALALVVTVDGARPGVLDIIWVSPSVIHFVSQICFFWCGR